MKRIGYLPIYIGLCVLYTTLNTSLNSNNHGPATHTHSAEKEQLNEQFGSAFKDLMNNLKELYPQSMAEASTSNKTVKELEKEVDQNFDRVKTLLQEEADVNYMPQGEMFNPIEQVINNLGKTKYRLHGLLYLLLSYGAKTDKLSVDKDGLITDQNGKKTLAGSALQEFFGPLAIRAVLFGRPKELREVLKYIPLPGSIYSYAHTAWNPNLDINGTDSFGLTALQWAAIRGETEMVKLLLTHGANPNQTTPDGHTPAQLAIMHNHPEIASIITQYKTTTQQPYPGTIGGLLTSIIGSYAKTS